MRVCIVGLGAVGGWMAGWLGSRLPPGRVTLSALARGATLAAVRSGGLQLHTADGQVSTVHLHTSDDPAALGVQDLVIVAVKAPALAAVAPAVQAMCGPQTLVLTAMNGVPWWFFSGLPGACEGLHLEAADPSGVLQRLLPPAQVIGCVVHAAGSVRAPGQVQHGSGNGLVIGRPSGAIDAPLQDVAALLADAGFAVTVSARIQRDLWFKLWGNMTMNPVSALTGATVDRILDDPLVRAFCSAVMREAQAIGHGIGIDIDQQPEDRHAVTRKLGAIRTSMLQDCAAGRALELDALVGAVREIGSHLSLATPHTDALLGLTRLMASVRGLA